MGFSALTVEGVASRAGVGKATIYRRWPSKLPLVVEAFGELPALEDVDTGSVEARPEDDAARYLELFHLDAARDRAPEPRRRARAQPRAGELLDPVMRNRRQPLDARSSAASRAASSRPTSTSSSPPTWSWARSRCGSSSAAAAPARHGRPDGRPRAGRHPQRAPANGGGSMARYVYERLSYESAALLARVLAALRAHSMVARLRGGLARTVRRRRRFRRDPHRDRVAPPRCRLPPASCAAYPARESPGLGGRPRVQPRLPPAPHRPRRPGEMAQLRQVVARIQVAAARPLPPALGMLGARGLAGGRFALLCEAAPAMLARIGRDLMEVLLSPRPDRGLRDAAAASCRARCPLRRSWCATRWCASCACRARRCAGCVAFAARRTRRRGARAARAGRGATARLLDPRAHDTPLTGRAGPHRRFATLVIPLARRAARAPRARRQRPRRAARRGRRRGRRRYFRARHVNPATLDFRAAVPVSLRTGARTRASASGFIDLPIWEKDPARRLERVRRRPRS